MNVSNVVLLSAIAIGTLPADHPEREIRALVLRLQDIDDATGYEVARDLAALKSRAMPFLIDGLISSDSQMRKWCARAMTNINHSNRSAAAAGGLPLLEALKREKDETVKWYIVQAVGSIQPDPERSIPVLLNALNDTSLEVRMETVFALEQFGSKANRATTSLIELIPNSELDLQAAILLALRTIGLDSDGRWELSRLNVADGSVAAHMIFDDLVEHANVALQFLQAHPTLLSTLPENHVALVELFSRKDPERDQLRAYIVNQENLPRFIRVDRALGESYGYVLTVPRVETTMCFPQWERIVKFVGDTADLGALNSDPIYKVWFTEGLAHVRRDGKWEYIDESGRIIVKPQVRRASPVTQQH